MNGGSSSSRTKYSEEAGLQPAAVASAAHDPDEWRSAGESNPWLPPGQGGTLATELAEQEKRKMDERRWRARKESNLQPLGLESSALPIELHTRDEKKWSEWQDLNLQPPASKAGRLPD